VNVLGSHKECNPRETIQTLRKILLQLEILPIETNWEQFGDLHSLRLEDSEYPKGWNGKGVTREFALASAYAEFVERIQNEDFYGRDFGLMKVHERFYPDEVVCKTSSLMENIPSVMLSLSDVSESSALEELADEYRCAPYADLNGKKVHLLPF